MEVLVKANGTIVTEQTAGELRAELIAEFEKILNLEAAEPCREEGDVIATAVSGFCRRLPAYPLDREDALLILRSIVDLCEQWNQRQEYSPHSMAILEEVTRRALRPPLAPNLSTTVDKPQTERQARELAPLPPVEQRKSKRAPRHRRKRERVPKEIRRLVVEFSRRLRSEFGANFAAYRTLKWHNVARLLARGCRRIPARRATPAMRPSRPRFGYAPSSADRIPKSPTSKSGVTFTGRSSRDTTPCRG